MDVKRNLRARNGEEREEEEVLQLGWCAEIYPAVRALEGAAGGKPKFKSKNSAV